MDIITIMQTLAYVVLYAIIGFGPGVFFGIIVANIIGAYRKPSISENQIKSLKSADVHNAQWHPSHKKWHSDK